jgi:hypothetical protein
MERNSNNNQIDQKLLHKLIKLQEDREKEEKDQASLLIDNINQLNKLMERLISVTESGSTVAATKKYVPFHTGSEEAGQLIYPPQNPDDYPTKIDVYSINNNRVVPHMTLVNDGPGEIFFINAYAKNTFNEKEGHLNVNDQRELFNVFEIRLRSSLPLTTFRLIEGIFRTGSSAPQTKINTTIAPTLQTNEILKPFQMIFDVSVPNFTIDVPLGIPPIITDFAHSLVHDPLPPGQTATYIDPTTGMAMPTLIPEGFIGEAFALFTNFNTDFTARVYIENPTGSGLFPPNAVFPCSNRGLHINQSQNLSFFSTQVFDPILGAPAPGRKILITITNDDPFNNMIGSSTFLIIFRRLS